LPQHCYRDFGAIDSGFDLIFSFARVEAKEMFYFNPPNCTSSPCESRRQDRGRAGAGRILVQSAEEERNKSRAGRRAKTHP